MQKIISKKAFIVFLIFSLVFSLVGVLIWKVQTEPVSDRTTQLLDIPVSFPASYVENIRLELLNNNSDRDYDYPQAYQEPGTVRIPVLAYHHIDTMPEYGKDIYVSPEIFEQQMAYLKSKNYKTITPEEYFEQLKSGENPKQKTVLITFGDGNRDNYTNAYPILKKYGFTGAFYIITNVLNINPNELKEMSDNGMSIQNHSATHTDLTYVTDPGFLQKEVIDTKTFLESITGKPVISFLYPNCGYNDTVKKVIENSGQKLAFTCGANIDNKFDNRFALNRIYIYNDLENFKKRLSGFVEEASY